MENLKVVEYYVVRNNNMVEFTESVNKYIKNGWVCQGGISCHNILGFYQAMVKYENLTYGKIKSR